MNPMTLRAVTAASLSFTTLVTACGAETADPTSPSTASTAAPSTSPSTAPVVALDGRMFVATGSTGFEIVPDSTIRISFDGGSLSATAGCNIIGGTYTVDSGGTLHTDALSMTEMACADVLMQQDDRFVEFLSAGPTVELDGDDLTLASVDASIRFLDREVADPDRPLAGPRWVVDSIITGDSAMGGFGDAEAAITFADDLVIVEAGCNTGSAPVTIGDGTITFGALVLTEIACTGPAMELETAVVATLAGEVTFEIEAGRLTLMAGANGLSLHADD